MVIACTKTVSDISIVECRGDINATSMVSLKNMLRRLMERNRSKVVLDIGKAKHVDLAGLGILVERIREARDAEGDIRICNMRPSVRKAFKMVGVYKVLDTFSSQTSAVRSFQVA